MEVGNLSVPVSANLGPITADLERLKKQLAAFDAQMLAGVGKATNGATQQTNQLRDALGRFAKQTDTATNSTGQARDALGRFVKVGGDTNAMLGENAQRTMSFTSALGPLAAALAGVFSVRALIQFTDTWTDLTSRVNLAAGSIEKGSAVMDQLQVIARRTYSSLQQTTEGYIRNAQTLRDLGRSTQDTLDYTEALNNALVVSGARADRAARVQEALGRGLAAGALRGQELNTVIESGGRVAELLAEELGTTVSGLRKFGSEGKITGDVIDRALVGNLVKLREEAESMPATIGDAFTLIGNALLQTIGVFDSANEISGTFASGLIYLADNMQRLVTYVATAAVGWGTFTAAVALANAGLFTLNGLLALTRAALIRLGIGAVIVAAGELVYQFTRLVKATGGWGNALNLLGEVASGVWDGIKTSASSIPPALNSVWLNVRADFALLMRDLGTEWNKFISIFEKPALTVQFGKDGKVHELIGGLDVSRFKADTSAAISTAAQFRNEAGALRDEAGKLATEGFDKAREALAKLNIEMEKGSTDLSGDGGPNRVAPNAGGEGKKSKAQRDAERLKEAYQDLIRDSQAFIASQEIEQQAIGMTELEAAKLRATFDLLNQAQRAGITLTAAQTEELTNLAHQMAEAEYATSRLREQYDFAKDTFKGFFGDLKSELQNGASIWEAFGTAAANALQKIADKALDMALNGIFDMIFGAFGVGGGGGGGGNWFTRLLGFENGTSFAPGGMAVVGERGPELLKLPGGSQVIPNNRVMSPSQASFGGGSGSMQQRMAIDIFVKDDGKIGAIARQEAGSVVEVAIHDYDTNALPSSVERISNHPRIR